MSVHLAPRRISPFVVLAAVAEGGRQLRGCLKPAAGLAAIFVLIGLLIFALLLWLDLAQMILPFAGGFLLLGPVVLSGFIALRRTRAAGLRPGTRQVMVAFRQAPRGLWVVAGVCALLFLIWISDAATVYSFMIGVGAARETGQVLRFHALTGVMGAVLAFIVFCISAFSVPLLFDRRANLVEAVTASVKAVFTNFGSMLLWSLVLTVAVIATILFPPLLLLSLPCLAFASDLIYLEIFPPDEGLPDTPSLVQDCHGR
ncbi:DUF2189 domain-containing protein [Zoogloea sp.]|uniref:DUF2189 domain-containing protein n=1 Tax=Zoogloea sp. TaxID=49181 RepID=UPI0035AD938D